MKTLTLLFIGILPFLGYSQFNSDSIGMLTCECVSEHWDAAEDKDIIVEPCFEESYPQFEEKDSTFLRSLPGKDMYDKGERFAKYLLPEVLLYLITDCPTYSNWMVDGRAEALEKMFHQKSNFDLDQMSRDIERDPIPLRYTLRAFEYLLRQMDDECIEDINTALELDPNTEMAWYVLTLFHETKADFQKAYAACVKLNTTSNKLEYKIMLKILELQVSSSKRQVVDSETLIERIDNTKTDQHLSLIGTGVSLIPAPGMKLSKSSQGFEKYGQPAIVAMVYNDQAYETSLVLNGYKYYQSRKATNITSKTIIINGYNATLFEMQMNESSKAISLIMGEDSMSVILMGTCPIYNDVEINALRQAILSMHFDEDKVGLTMEEAPFSIDTSKFKLWQFASGLFMFTENGEPYDITSPERVITVSEHLSSDPEKTYKLLYGGIMKDGYDELSELDFSRKKVNGYETFERTVAGKLRGKYQRKYILILSDGETAIMFHGVLWDKSPKSLEEIKKIGHSIRIK